MKNVNFCFSVPCLYGFFLSFRGGGAGTSIPWYTSLSFRGVTLISGIAQLYMYIHFLSPYQLLKTCNWPEPPHKIPFEDVYTRSNRRCIAE